MPKRNPATGQWPDEEITDPIHARDETCYFDRSTRTYKVIPKLLPDTIEIGMRILQASQALYDSAEVRAIDAAGLGDSYRRMVCKIAAAAARAVRDDIAEATCPRQ